MFGITTWRRNRIKARPFPAAWLAVLDGVAVYQRVNEDDRAELRGHILVFLAEKYIEGCAGLEVTDEIKVTIAANACVLLLHREADYYPNCKTVLVYPQEYIATGKRLGAMGIVTEQVERRAGESWHNAYAPASGGPVILSWRSVRRGAHCGNDGHNVVFHEFAHQLDGESGGMDGAPALELRSHFLPWARVLGAEYDSLVRGLAGGERPALINPYGAQNPAEFFAVCTELFFERPREMKAHHGDLYARFSDYFQQDPAQWAECEAGGARGAPG